MPTKTYDLIIVGAGPSALTAAVYSSREGLNTLLIEKSVVGGLAAMTDTIDNYPGFPEGIGGFEIADRMQKQAERFGSKIEFGEVTAIKNTVDKKFVVLDGKEMQARSILIASGSSFAKVGVVGESEYYGCGVHYCATCDGAFYVNKKVIVIGGGNSAIQEAIFLTKFASHIDIVALFGLSASGVLKQQLKKHINEGKITVHENTKTKEILAKDGKVVGIAAIKGKKSVIIKADGVFVFIGLSPNTQFLEGSGIELDERGFIMTDNKLQTNISGIFASGDVRSGATLQVASAVGDGATAALSIREYLSVKK